MALLRQEDQWCPFGPAANSGIFKRWEVSGKCLQTTMENQHEILMGKTTLSMAMFNSKLLVYHEGKLESLASGAIQGMDPRKVCLPRLWSRKSGENKNGNECLEILEILS